MVRKYLGGFFILLLLVGCRSEYTKNQEYIIPPGTYQIFSDRYHFHIQTIFDSTDSTLLAVLNRNDSIKSCLWEIKHTGGKTYRIQSVESGLYLTFLEGSIVLTEEIDSEKQLWIIHKYKGERFKIINSSEKVCLCLPDKVNMNNLLVYRKCNNRPNEYWYINN